ncbi:MAG: GYD domain-containing protein [Pseudorhodobacter sp.]|nr:GYD domain-containing protein [Pseudorhodobacter sp.]
MPFYLFQGRYTAAAMKAMVENPQDREVAGRALVEAAGGKLHHLFFAFGAEDVVALIEAPDDIAMASGVMALAASGGFSGGATTKLMTAQDAMKAMKGAQAVAQKYSPPRA